MDRRLSSYYFFILLVFIFSFFSSNFLSFASVKIKRSQIQVAKVFKVQVRSKNLTGQSGENSYFVDQGLRAGLIPGHLVNVYRKIEILQKEKKGILMFQDMWLPVGKAIVIYSGENISLVRLYQAYKNIEGPSLFYSSILLGDLLDLSSIRPRVVKSVKHYGKAKNYGKPKNYSQVKDYGQVRDYGKVKNYNKVKYNKVQNLDQKSQSFESIGKPIGLKPLEAQSVQGLKRVQELKNQNHKSFEEYEKKLISRKKEFIKKRSLELEKDPWKIEPKKVDQVLSDGEDSSSEDSLNPMQLLPDHLLGSFDRSFYDE